MMSFRIRKKPHMKKLEDEVLLRGKSDDHVEILDPAELDDASFVLFYAFYKDLASTNRTKIPTFHDLQKKYHSAKNESYILSISRNSVVYGSMWVTIKDSVVTIEGIGSIMEGTKQAVESLLLYYVFDLAFAKHCNEIIITASAFPVTAEKKKILEKTGKLLSSSE